LLRGLLLVGAPKLISEGSRVAEWLLTIGITEERWGWYLMACGGLQIWFADQKASFMRVIIAALIMVGFGAMFCGFYVAYSAHDVPPSIICMTVFYLVMFGRVLGDWWEARKDGRNYS